jgi:hypothetical protein
VKQLRKCAGLLPAFALCALVAFAAPAYATHVSALHPGSETPMLSGVQTTLQNPDAPDIPAGTTPWNVYDEGGATLMDAGFSSNYGSPIADLLSPFVTTNDGGGYLAGTIYSEVYRHATDGHLLFVYTISNDEDSTTGIAFSNLVDWDSIDITDAGELLEEAAVTPFLTYSRSSSGTNLRFTFQNDQEEGALLMPGDVSTHAYAETDAKLIIRGLATVQDTALGEDNIPVLVPTFVPEPLTMVGLFLGLGSVGVYIRKRRMA